MGSCRCLGRSLGPTRVRSTPTNQDTRQRMRSRRLDGDAGNGRGLHGSSLGDAQTRAQSEAAYAPADFVRAWCAPRRVHGRARDTSPWSEPPCGRAYRRRALQKPRSEEHTSELQSHLNLVCRLLLEKKKIKRLKTANAHTNY